MRDYKPVTKTMDIGEIEDSLATVVTSVSRNDARVVVERHGQPVAAIISIEDLRRFAELQKAEEDSWAAIDTARAAFAHVPETEHEAQVARAIAEVRAGARSGTDRE